MKKLLQKKLTKKGFTLAELLIVVAILAILVAVSVPIFTTKLADAKKATDEANLRACKALVVNALLTEDFPDDVWTKTNNGEAGQPTVASCKFDAENGCLVKNNAEIKRYGEGSLVKGETNSPVGNDFYNMINDSGDAFICQKNSYLVVMVSPNISQYVIYWANY